MDLTPHQRVIAWRLLEGRRIHFKEMVQALYGGDPEGGPLWAQETCRIHAWKLRRALLPYGIEVKHEFGFGSYIETEDIERAREILADELDRNVIPFIGHGRRGYRTTLCNPTLTPNQPEAITSAAG